MTYTRNASMRQDSCVGIGIVRSASSLSANLVTAGCHVQVIIHGTAFHRRQQALHVHAACEPTLRHARLAGNHILSAVNALAAAPHSTQSPHCHSGISTNLLNVTSHVLRSLSSGGLSMSKCQTSLGSESGMNMLSARGTPAAHAIPSTM